MLYSEFLKNTGAKSTPYNYRVYKGLEKLYMENDEMTKEAVYSAGKLLIDNALTTEQKAWNNEINEKIEQCKRLIEYTQWQIDSTKDWIEDGLCPTGKVQELKRDNRNRAEYLNVQKDLLQKYESLLYV